MGHDAEGENSNQTVIATANTERRQLVAGPKSPKEEILVGCPLKFLDKNHNEKAVRGRLENKLQTAISETENTMVTDTQKPVKLL